MFKEIVFSVFDVLATYDLTKQVDDFLPVVVTLMPICEPLKRKVNKGEKVQPMEALTLKILSIIEAAYQTDTLTIESRTALLDLLDLLGQRLGL